MAMLFFLVASHATAQENQDQNADYPGSYELRYDLIPELRYEPIPFSKAGGAIDIVVTRDTDDFERNVYSIGGMVRYASSSDFLAVGASRNEFRQGADRIDVDSLLVAYRKINPRTAEGLNLRAGLALAGDTTKIHGEGSWNLRFSESTGAEFIASRDAIETMPALRQGWMANFFAVSVDHAVTDRVTVIGMPTYRTFSDGNEQTGVRGWLIYSLLPEYGLSASVRARAFTSSQDGGGVYFSPEDYERVEAGLRLRRSIGHWRIFATMDFGQEKVNHAEAKPTSQYVLSAQRNLPNGAALGIQANYFRSGDSLSNSTGSDKYAWRLARLYFVMPF
jgi:Putative beta-barrel porin 2